MIIEPLRVEDDVGVCRESMALNGTPFSVVLFGNIRTKGTGEISIALSFRNFRSHPFNGKMKGDLNRLGVRQRGWGKNDNGFWQSKSFPRNFD